MAARALFRLALPAALLAAGCAALTGPGRPWDPDRPVLPLRHGAAAGPAPAAEESLPASYVILLPNDDGTVGEIVIDRPDGSVVLDRPGLMPLDRTALAPLDVAAPAGVFAEALAFEPRAPASYELYFPIGEAEPTAESRRRLQEILAAIADWPGAEVSLAGHSDRSGTEADNERLSRRRAEAIRDALLAAGVRPDLVEASWYGESRAAVPTADGVREPRNRRVEIRIR